jgi:hypothetical protein
VKLDMKLVVDHATGKWFLEEASEAKKKVGHHSNSMFVTLINYVPE